MAGIVDAGQVHGMLVQWRGDDGADGARLGVVDGGADVVVGAASGLGAELPRRQVGGQGGTAADDLDQAGAQAGLGRRGNLDHVQARAQRGGRGGSAPASPYTTCGARRPCAQAWTTISGPMPAASPMVMPTGSLVFTICVGKGFAWANATPGSAGGLLLRLPVAVVLDSTAAHSKVTVARLGVRPVALLDVILGLTSLLLIDWQYSSARCRVWFFSSTQVSQRAPRAVGDAVGVLVDLRHFAHARAGGQQNEQGGGGSKACEHGDGMSGW